MRKRLVSFVMALSIAASMLVTPAFAATTAGEFDDYLTANQASSGTTQTTQTVEAADGSYLMGNFTVKQFPQGTVISVKKPATDSMEVMSVTETVLPGEPGTLVFMAHEFRITSDHQMYLITLREGQKHVRYIFVQGTKATTEDTGAELGQSDMHDGPSDEELRIFDDVDPSAWYADGVRYCYNTGLMAGVGNNKFDPGREITRAMAWVMLARLHGMENVGGEYWFSGAQKWVKANGISDGQNPNSPLTREQLLTMMYRYAEMCDCPYYDAKNEINPETGKPINTHLQDRTDFVDMSDYSQIADYAKWPMQFLYDAVVFNGTSKTTVSPKVIVNRAQAATMFMSFRENYAIHLFEE